MSRRPPSRLQRLVDSGERRWCVPIVVPLRECVRYQVCAHELAWLFPTKSDELFDRHPDAAIMPAGEGLGMVQQLSVMTSATLVPFPLKARTADVRGAAAILTMASVSEAAVTEHWVRITDRLARQLDDCGFDPIVIAMELCDFEDAVDAEIARRLSTSSRH